MSDIAVRGNSRDSEMAASPPHAFFLITNL
jgi:hypothetical protein